MCTHTFYVSSEVKDKNIAGAALIGEGMVSLQELLKSDRLSQDIALPLTVKGKKTKVR
jgi:hypothetical protein